MNYPLLSEYIEAVKAAEDNFEELKHLRPVLDEDGQPVMSSGNFAVVFKMKDEQSGKLHAVKCFLKDQEGRAEAYRLIAEELEYVSSTFLTPIRYLDKELFVDSNACDDTEYPVLLMDWVEGQTLDKYIREHIDDEYELALLAYQFSRLAMWLIPQPFAHGDLKPDNILVREDGTLVLVDYDGMYVPAMKGQKARELGSPDFRHPGRTEDDFDEHIDDFSLISILLSLKAISLQPDFLEKYGATDRLLFSENDYRNISQCELLKEIFPSTDSELNILQTLFILALEKTNLADVSFRLLNLSRPKEPEYENLSTEVTEEDLANAWTDEFGVMYSKDRKRLLKAPEGLNNYSIKDGTAVICNQAFHYCKLESISIPDSIKILGTGAFAACKKICAIVLPEKLSDIGNCAFAGCESLQTINIPQDVEIIGFGAFSKCKNLKSIIIPQQLSRIEQGVFSDCNSLSSITIPDNIVEIGHSAFDGCRSLTSLVIPDSITKIENNAFSRCKELKSILIPRSVKEIGVAVFSGCDKLTSITVDEENEIYDSRNNCNAIIETKTNCLIAGCSSTLIPNNVSSIGQCAFFSCEGLASMVIPESVKKIEDAAFVGSSIISIKFSDYINWISTSAFKSCWQLRRILVKKDLLRRYEKVLPLDIVYFLYTYD